MGALESAEFFAPTTSNRWDFLFEDHEQMRAEIGRIAERQQDPTHRAAMAHFLSAARRNDRGISVLPSEADAVRELDATFWQKAMLLTDVLDYMPAKARDEWHESIRSAKTPPFEPDTVPATICLLRLDTYKPGDLPPEGYLAWHEWAEVQHKAGIPQVECGKCGLWRTPQELSGQSVRWVVHCRKGPMEKIAPICSKCAT